MTKAQATLDLEVAIHTETGHTLIAGLDEAGRGPLAGPVVAAAVILPLHDTVALDKLRVINDSKQLTPKRREAYYRLIMDCALAYGIGSSSPVRIDREGIVPATKHAMHEALNHLQPKPEYLLIDGRIRLKDIPTPQQSIIRGDSKSLSIAAASILAKVKRDRYMIELSELYPQYGFANHKGYATPQHLATLERFGPTQYHRHTFSPVRKKLL